MTGWSRPRSSPSSGRIAWQRHEHPGAEMGPHEGYAPGWDDDALAMMARRTSTDRAGFVLPLLATATRLLDVGCGPGTITVGLAKAAPGATVLGVDRESSQVDRARAAASRAGTANARFQQASVYELPVGDGGVDLVFAHAVFEHLASPAQALAEIARVLRPGGLVALASSDWSAARLDPYDDDVDLALRAHHLLRRRAGGDPFLGGALPGLVAAGGFADVRTQRAGRSDMTYDELARYVGTRLARAASEVGVDDAELLRSAAAAAHRWSARSGTFVQRWVEVVGRRPGPAAPRRPPRR